MGPIESIRLHGAENAISNLENTGKSDKSVRDKFDKDRSNYEHYKGEYKKYKELVRSTQEKIDLYKRDLSILHPIRNIKDFRAISRLNKNLKAEINNMKVAKKNYKKAHKEYKQTARVVRHQSRCVNESKDFARKVDEARKLGIAIPGNVISEYNRIMSNFPNQTFGYDSLGASVGGIPPVDKAGYNMISRMVMQKKAKDLAEKAADKVYDVAQDIGQKIGNHAKNRETQPEI